jgi:5-methylthioadenosine/S-adenosylhomocysteine deaminase
MAADPHPRTTVEGSLCALSVDHRYRANLNTIPNLVYAGSGHEIVTVMVAGKVPVRDGEVLVADEGAIRTEAQVQAEEVARRATADPAHKDMALLEAMEKGRL